MIKYESDTDLAEHLIDPKYKLRFLAEGDSWFSIGGLTNNLLDAIDRDDWLIVSCAYPGDTLKNMAQLCNEPFQRLLNPKFGCRWDGILLSGGGNDIMTHCWQVVDHSGIKWGNLSEFLDDVVSHLITAAKHVRRNGHTCPILVNCYDWPTPKLNGWFELGPWMGPQFHSVGLPESEWSRTAATLIDAFVNWLRVASNEHYGLHIVDARGKADKAVWHNWNPFAHRGDWRNEIHLTSGGYGKHAEVWRAVINEVIGEKYEQQQLF